MYELLANLVVALHALFVLFAVTGILLVWRWPRAAWLHIPAFLWAVLIEWAGGICPLTPLENLLRRLAGGTGYEGGFLAHYLVPLLYPPGLTRGHQWLLGGLLLTFNLIGYGLLLRRTRRSASPRT